MGKKSWYGNLKGPEYMCHLIEGDWQLDKRIISGRWSWKSEYRTAPLRLRHRHVINAQSSACVFALKPLILVRPPPVAGNANHHVDTFGDSSMPSILFGHLPLPR
jgi:hypothetical protein